VLKHLSLLSNFSDCLHQNISCHSLPLSLWKNPDDAHNIYMFYTILYEVSATSWKQGSIWKDLQWSYISNALSVSLIYIQSQLKQELHGFHPSIRAMSHKFQKHTADIFLLAHLRQHTRTSAVLLEVIVRKRMPIHICTKCIHLNVFQLKV
jgi:hypothetical protein